MLLRRRTLFADRTPLSDAAADAPVTHAVDITTWLTEQGQLCSNFNVQSDPERPGWLVAMLGYELDGGLRIKLEVAQSGNAVVICEKVHGHRNLRQSLPDLLAMLPAYEWQNIDRFPIAKFRSLQFNRIEAFEEFVYRPRSERRLPVILISLTPDNRLAVHPRLLAERLGTMAHIVVRRDRLYWGDDAGRLQKRSFNGSVALYAPDFRDDLSSRYGLWTSEKFAPELQEATLSEITNRVLDICADDDHDAEIFDRVGNELAKVAGAREERARAEVRIRDLRESSGKTVAELDDLLGILDQENHSLRLELQVSNRDRSEALDLIRELQYRLKSQWATGGGSTAETDEEITGPAVWLSAQAYEVIERLDAGERGALYTQILSKLLDPRLRNGQMESVEAGSDLRVYPRKRSAGGKRAILREEGEDVLVCELYIDHDAYEERRDRGFTGTEYTRHVEWHPPAQ